MNCQRARDIFPELLDPRTRADEHAETRAHLGHCPECQREFATLSQTLAALDAIPTPTPSPSLRKNFYALLEEEKHSAASVLAAAERTLPLRGQRAPRAARWRWLLSPLFGCALLALGFVVGQRTTPPPPPAAAPQVAATVDDSMRRELLALREQMAEQREQLNKMTTLVGYSILQQQQNPANERLQEVLVAARAEQPGEKVIDDLISALTLDPSANVRLRALEALYRHAERDTVRAGVLAALPREQNPLVQLELIDFVAAAQEPDAAPLLERMSANEAIDRTVRDAARLALAHL